MSKFRSPLGRHNYRRRRPRPRPVVLPPIVITGTPTVSTTGVVGEKITVTSWPTTNREGTVSRKLRYYTAQTGGSVTGTEVAYTDDMPNANFPDRFAVVVYQVYDAVYNTTVEVESARWDINTTSTATRIDKSQITWFNSWILKDGRRTLVQPEFTISGITNTMVLQARINCERYTMGWVDCVLQANGRWRPGVSLCPQGHPHQGLPLNELLPQLEDGWKWEFRYKTSSASTTWSPTSLWIVVPMPATLSQEFFETPTTVADLRAAILDAKASSEWRIIGCSGTYTLNDSSLTFSGTTGRVVKSGAPLVITSVDRSAPANFRGYTGRCFYFNDITTNLIIDRLNFVNNRMESIGSNKNSPKIAYADYYAGQPITVTGGTRVYVQNCLFENIDVGLEWRDCSRVYTGFCRWKNTTQDGLRFFWRGDNILVEGEDHDVAHIYRALSLADDYDVNIYHPDVIQISTHLTQRSNRTDTRAGGFVNFRRIKGRSMASDTGTGRYTAGYYGNEAIRNVAQGPVGGTTWNAHLSKNWSFENMWIETGYNNGFVIQCVDGVKFHRVVCRSSALYERRPSLFTPTIWAANITVTECVSYYNWYVGADSWAQTSTAMKAQITGSAVTGNTAVPPNWPTTGARAGKNCWPCGPDAYRSAPYLDLAA